MAAAIFPWNVLKGLKPPAAPENYFSGEISPVVSPATKALGTLGTLPRQLSRALAEGSPENLTPYPAQGNPLGLRERLLHCWLRGLLMFDPAARARWFSLLRQLQESSKCHLLSTRTQMNCGFWVNWTQFLLPVVYLHADAFSGSSAWEAACICSFILLLKFPGQGSV